ncbi:hypothetical protein HBE96_05875 [Clostridium sp. P21]|uniref:Uncharacterized protein n=1 Tax=Clostridium muellerianum TaxID=2716538 RepID=A0A7Y0HMJ1_9CLOT|nr:hypothetical protein [Clostridium muellerianum]NMM62220.1 hypothetical protein [Clostridium muellerianum]
MSRRINLKKRNKSKKIRRTRINDTNSKKVHAIVKMLVATRVFCSLIYLIFYTIPKDAWVSFDGTLNSINLSKNVVGSIGGETKLVYSSGGIISNYLPIKIQYNDKTVELKEGGFKIVFSKRSNVSCAGNIGLGFNNCVNIYNRNALITNHLQVSGDIATVGNGEIYEGIKHNIYNKKDDELHGITWELGGAPNMEILFDQFGIDNLYSVFINDTPLNLRNIKDNIMKIQSSDEKFPLRLAIDTKSNLSFKVDNRFRFTGKSDNVGLLTASKANLTFINSSTPQQLQVPLTSLSIKRLETEARYKNNDEYLQAKDDPTQMINNDFDIKVENNPNNSDNNKGSNKNKLECLISGRVKGISLSNKSLFPNITQWIIYNSNALTTILITTYVSIIFNSITKKE